MRNVWVLTWREELEVNSNQTEEVESEVFWRRDDAIAYARKVLRKYARKWWPKDPEEALVESLTELERELRKPRDPGYLYLLSDSDNLVFGLTRKRIRARR